MGIKKINLKTGRLIKDGKELFNTGGTGRADVELYLGEEYENHKDKIQVMAEEEERRRAEEYAAYQQRDLNEAIKNEWRGVPSEYGLTHSATKAVNNFQVEDDFSPVFDGRNFESISGVNATPDQFEKELAMQELMDYSNKQKIKYSREHEGQMIGNQIYPSDRLMAINGISPNTINKEKGPSVWEKGVDIANDAVIDSFGAAGYAAIDAYDWASGMFDKLNNLNRPKDKPKRYGIKGTK
jgi:hypothetical protein